jgi:hypothetical protein
MTEPDGLQMTLQLGAEKTIFACWMAKATDVHLEYVILISFPLPKVLTRIRLNITLYAHCLSCLFIIHLRKINQFLCTKVI